MNVYLIILAGDCCKFPLDLTVPTVEIFSKEYSYVREESDYF